MLETSARMGRQREENDKYRVTWTYHPDEGLEVTYEKNYTTKTASNLAVFCYAHNISDGVNAG